MDQKGFTLIELVVVIGILALLLTITLIAINPGRQFGRANDTKRHSDVVQISNAIYQNIAENQGRLVINGSAFSIPLTPAVISNTGTANICAGLVPDFMPSLPQDPSQNNGDQITSCTTYNTGYELSQNLEGRIKVAAPQAESDEEIEVTR